MYDLNTCKIMMDVMSELMTILSVACPINVCVLFESLQLGYYYPDIKNINVIKMNEADRKLKYKCRNKMIEDRKRKKYDNYFKNNVLLKFLYQESISKSKRKTLPKWISKTPKTQTSIYTYFKKIN